MQLNQKSIARIAKSIYNGIYNDDPDSRLQFVQKIDLGGKYYFHPFYKIGKHFTYIQLKCCLFHSSGESV